MILLVGDRIALLLLLLAVFTIASCWFKLKAYVNCQRPVFPLSAAQHMDKIKNLWKFELNWSSKLRENNERKKHPWHKKLCAFRCLISGPQNLFVISQQQLQIFSWQITFFLKTMLLQREPFLTMFHTINSFPLLVTPTK